jgi:hypothetical protein
MLFCPKIQLLERVSFRVYEAGVRSRYFFTETFNASGGLSYDHITGELGFEATQLNIVQMKPYQATAYIGKIGLGNLWSVNNNRL